MATDIDTREFSVTLKSGEDVNFTTRMANNEEIQDSEFEYSRVFNKAIMAGILPQSTLLAKLIEAEIWSPEKDRAIEQQRVVVAGIEEKLGEEESESAREALARDLSDERAKLYNMRQEKIDLLAHTAEAKADEVQRNFIVSRVTARADTKKPVWKSYEEYRKEQDGGLLFRATYEYLTFINGLPSDFVDALPENQILANAETTTADAPVEEASAKTAEEPVSEEPQSEAEATSG